MATRKFTVTYHDNGNIVWRDEEGRYSRPDGPAVEYANGYKAWCVDDKLHRLDGPAVEYADGTKEWHIVGKSLSEEQFHAEVKRRQDASCAGRMVEVDGVKYRLEVV